MSHDNRQFDDAGRFLPRRFREFTVCVGNASSEHYSGIGLTPETLIENHCGLYSGDYWDTFDEEAADGRGGGVTPEQHAADWPNHVIWEGSRAVALVRPYPDGRRELEVIRFDAPAVAPPRPFKTDGCLHEAFVYPHKAKSPGAPLVTFRVVGECGMLDAVHEGRGLTLDEVLAVVTENWTKPEWGGGDPYDMTVMRDEVVVAICRNLGDCRWTLLTPAAGEPPASEAEDDQEGEDMSPREMAEQIPSVKDEMSGIATVLAMGAQRQRGLPVAWSITEGDNLLYHTHHARTLDQVLAEELEDGPPDEGDWDRAIWHGEELAATIRRGRNGMAEVWRFDNQEAG